MEVYTHVFPGPIIWRGPFWTGVEAEDGINTNTVSIVIVDSSLQVGKVIVDCKTHLWVEMRGRERGREEGEREEGGKEGEEKDDMNL